MRAVCTLTSSEIQDNQTLLVITYVNRLEHVEEKQDEELATNPVQNVMCEHYVSIRREKVHLNSKYSSTYFSEEVHGMTGRNQS